MKTILRLLTLPIRIATTLLIWACALLIRISGLALGLASGLLLLLGLAVLTFSVKNALLVFALAFLVSPLGLPMMAVGLLSLLNKLIRFLTFA